MSCGIQPMVRDHTSVVPAPACARRRVGFTLIELVISAALMSVVLVAAYACLRAAIAGRKLVETRSDVAQTARVAFALLSADLRAACPLSREFEFLGLDRALGEVEADNLDFATHNYSPRSPREGDFCEVSYFVRQDAAGGRLSLWRRRDSTPDAEPLAGGTLEEIAGGVSALRLEYYDGWEWFDEWGDPEGKRRGQDPLTLPSNVSGLPEAVRITLSFVPEQSSGDEASSTTEPPLVFQTIVRLNLAAVSQEDRGTGSSSSSSTTNPANDAAPPGAN